METLYDITGREIKKGQILAVGVRSGNSGDLTIAIVKDIKEVDNEYVRNSKTTKIQVTSGRYLGNSNKTLIVPESVFVGTKQEKWIQEQFKKL